MNQRTLHLILTIIIHLQIFEKIYKNHQKKKNNNCAICIVEKLTHSE